MIPEKMQTDLKRFLYGQVVCSFIMLLVMWPLGRLRWQMLAGLLLGGCAAMVSLWMLANAVEQAVRRSSKGASAYMTGQYLLRYLLYGVVIVLGLRSPALDPLGTILPLFFPKLTIIFFQISDAVRRRRGH